MFCIVCKTNLDGSMSGTCMPTVMRVLQVLAEAYARQAQQESLLCLGQSTPGIIVHTWCVTLQAQCSCTYISFCVRCFSFADLPRGCQKDAESDSKLLLHRQLLTSMVATPHTHGYHLHSAFWCFAMLKTNCFCGCCMLAPRSRLCKIV